MRRCAACGGGGRERVDLDGFATLVTERSQIVVGDGVPRLAVELVDSEAWTLVDRSDGRMGSAPTPSPPRSDDGLQPEG